MLDSLRSMNYIAALARQNTAGVARVRCSWKALVAAMFLVMGVLGSSTASAADEARTMGVTLPAGAVRIDANRYRLPDGFETTSKWYARVYKPGEYPRRNIVNQPGIKAFHVVNSNKNDQWSGFNLYEWQGQVRLYILAKEKN